MEPAEPTSLVVCDAGPLIHLDELRSLALLSDFHEISVPDAVWREVERHRPAALRRRRVTLNRVDIIPEPTDSVVALIQQFGLHEGEQEALRLMQQFPEAILLTDDAAARTAAAQAGFRVHGTVGIVLRAWRLGQKSKRQVLNLLNAIPHRSTLHISRMLLQSIVEQVQEEVP